MLRLITILVPWLLIGCGSAINPNVGGTLAPAAGASFSSNDEAPVVTDPGTGGFVRAPATAVTPDPVAALPTKTYVGLSN